MQLNIQHETHKYPAIFFNDFLTLSASTAFPSIATSTDAITTLHTKKKYSEPMSKKFVRSTQKRKKCDEQNGDMIKQERT